MFVHASDPQEGRIMQSQTNQASSRPAFSEPLLTTQQAAAMLGFHPSYLAKARLTGNGPRYLAWKSIIDEHEALNLDPHQMKQAETQLSSADGAVSARL